MSKNYVAIMAGGIGSRFWPKSRVAYPKQFIDILGVGKSLLQLTYERFLQIVPKEHIYIVTNADYEAIVKKQLPELADHQILKEPMRRNTAPCVAYVSSKIYSLDPQANLVVAPSDHLVMDVPEFTRIINQALTHVTTKNDLLTLGIVPTRPDTGYGYIQYDEGDEHGGFYKVKTFTEKPDLELAKQFISSGDFLWNSGIFIWNAKTILAAFNKHLHDVYEVFHEGMSVYNTDNEQAFINKAYTLCTNISIDYGVMEKADEVRVIPSDFGWSDLGTWQSLYDQYPKDDHNNAVSGKQIMVVDSENCMVMAPNDKLVVLQGLDGYCVVDTGDALMICERDKEQEIKTYTAEIKKLKDGEKFL
ncbi:mannose-1-phosphate guanylyltransferase [soil metagenome]